MLNDYLTVLSTSSRPAKFDEFDVLSASSRPQWDDNFGASVRSQGNDELGTSVRAQGNNDFGASVRSQRNEEFNALGASTSRRERSAAFTLFGTSGRHETFLLRASGKHAKNDDLMLGTSGRHGQNEAYSSSPLIMSEKGTVELKTPKELDSSTNGFKTQPPAYEEPKPQFTEKKILKNVFVVSLGFTFLFTAFQSMSNLQTSLNREEGIGSISLALVYASLILSCLLLPKFVISRLGCKWTIPISMTGYILYMAANFYAVKGTMFTAAIFVGMGAAPLWSAKCTYLTQVGVWYARLTKQDKDAIINRFFGFFFLFFQSSQIWGNLISSQVFAPPKGNVSTNVVCGATFCGNVSGNFDQDKDKVYTVCGIYLACAVAAALIVAAFLDPIKLDKESSEDDRRLNPQLLLATFKHLIRSPIQVMLIPITIYSGVEQAFIAGDYTKAYISCSLGVWNLGYVMICYGVVDALCSFFFGQLVKYVGHIPFFVLAFLAHGGLQIGLLKWTPSTDEEIWFYVFAGIWGMGDAVIQTQLNALYGDVFVENTEAGFANYRLWESLGFTIAFAYNEYLCTDVKLVVCMGLLVVGMIGYGMVELSIRCKGRRSVDINNIDQTAQTH